MPHSCSCCLQVKCSGVLSNEASLKKCADSSARDNGKRRRTSQPAPLPIGFQGALIRLLAPCWLDTAKPLRGSEDRADNHKPILGGRLLAMSAAPRLRTQLGRRPRSEKGHVWTAPGWQGISSRLQYWSVRPCVRPLNAAHVTANHSALRGSGPGHKLAFDNAPALVGCPDPDRPALHYVLFALPNLHITPDVMSGVISFKPPARLVLCSVRLSPSSPTQSVRSCWRARWPRPSWVAASATRLARADAWPWILA
jgi:hypothetical protein